MIRRLAIRAVATALCLTPVIALSQDWALGGMDAVSYRVNGAAVPGQSTIVTLWHGQSWHFANEENRASFEANPRAYAPGLDGRCVVALAEGRSEPGNPHYFVVINHRTYLTHSPQARDRLVHDPTQLLRAAEATFSKISR